MSFIFSRCFGGGLPSTMMLPLADCSNHSSTVNITHNLLEKNLHKSMNKIYMYKHNFEEDGDEDDEDRMYDKSNCKIKIRCQKLFTEDEQEEMPQEVKDNWAGIVSEENKELYSEEIVLKRFRINQYRHSGQNEAETEERKIDFD